MAKPSARRAWGGAAFIVASCLAASGVQAGPHGLDPMGIGEAPERWRAEVALGDDRSGDLRVEAAAILDAIAGHGRPFTMRDARGLGVSAAVIFAAPPSIRIWRRGLDGSTASCSGRVDVIPFERYVQGVLPHEWIRSWDGESLKAGAVAIRTYAAAWIGAGGKYTCADLDDTTASQVYRDQFFANTDAAVDATVGQMVVRDGELVFAEYSAENSDPTAFGVVEPLCTGRDLYGHGRGTCQWGTQRWALDGQTYDWMMRHYYPGADVEGIAPAWGATLAAQEVRTELVSGEEIVVWLEYRNDGTTTWDPATVLVGTTGPRDRVSPFFKAENWVSTSRPTGADHAAQAPGAVARFTWAMVAPEVTEPTEFIERFGLVTADDVWFSASDEEVRWSITVRPAATSEGDGNGLVTGGCSSGGGGGGGAALPVLFAVLLLIARRRGDARAAIVVGATTVALTVLLGGCAPAPTRALPRGADPAAS